MGETFELQAAWSNKVDGCDITKDEQCQIIAVIMFIHVWFIWRRQYLWLYSVQ
jgi:hypothetical protein